MEDQIARASTTKANKSRGDASEHRRGFLFRFARHLSEVPSIELLLLGCVLLGGLLGALAVLGILYSPPAR